VTRLQYADTALADLADLHDWIAADNPNRAASFVDEMLEACRLVAAHPRIGRLREDLGPGVRVHVHQKRNIAYRDHGDRVVVIRVVHGSADLADALKSD